MIVIVCGKLMFASSAIDSCLRGCTAGPNTARLFWSWTKSERRAEKVCSLSLEVVSLISRNTRTHTKRGWRLDREWVVHLIWESDEEARVGFACKSRVHRNDFEFAKLIPMNDNLILE